MRRILCTVILVCAALTLAAQPPMEAKKSSPVAKPAATADVQQTLKDRFREYTEALTKRDLTALEKSGPRTTPSPMAVANSSPRRAAWNTQERRAGRQDRPRVVEGMKKLAVSLLTVLTVLEGAGIVDDAWAKGGHGGGRGGGHGGKRGGGHGGKHGGGHGGKRGGRHGGFHGHGGSMGISGFSSAPPGSGAHLIIRITAIHTAIRPRW